MRITVIDNDASLLKSLRIILTRQGHHVDCFADPVAAVSALAAENRVAPDVLLVGFAMPVMTGLELLAELSPKPIDLAAVMSFLGPSSPDRDYQRAAHAGNQELGAERDRWRAAMQVLPQATARHDPSFSRTDLIRHIGTRVGPQAP